MINPLDSDSLASNHFLVEFELKSKSLSNDATSVSINAVKT